MSKYGELCKAYNNAMEKSSDYEETCKDFIINFQNGFIKYLGCENGEVCFYGSKKVYKDPKGPLNIHEAIYLDDDTFWHFGLGIKLKGEDHYVDRVQILELAIKGEENKFTLKYDFDGGKLFKIKNSEDQRELEKVYGLLFDYLKERFDNQLEVFLNQKDSEDLVYLG